MINLTIKGQVVPLKTSRPIFVNKISGKPFVGKNKRLREYEKSAKLQLRSQYTGELLQGPVLVQFWYWLNDKRKRDLVNLLETTSDLLQGIVIEDDSQIKGYTQSQIKGIDKENPRTEITIVEAVE